MSALPTESNMLTVKSARAVSTPKRDFLPERTQSFLLLLPSLIVIAIFVYFFIGTTLYVSFSNWGTLKRDLTLREPIYQTYTQMFAMPRFQADLRNTIVFTVLFMTLAIVLGLSLAILLDRKIFGSALFRNIFLFPYALSFVVTGVAWRCWLFCCRAGGGGW